MKSTRNAPFNTSSEDVIRNVVMLLKKYGPLSDTDTFYDLGCGDAKVLMRVAKVFGCKCIGYEFNEKHAESAKNIIKGEGLASLIDIRSQDIFELKDLANAKAVFLYLNVKANAALESIIVPAFENGTIFVTNMFSLGYLGNPVCTVRCDGVTNLFLYSKSQMETLREEAQKDSNNANSVYSSVEDLKVKSDEDPWQWLKDLFDPLKNPWIIRLFHFAMGTLTILLLICILFDLGNIHVYNMGAIGVCLWVSVTWFMNEFRAAVEKETEGALADENKKSK